MQKIYYYRLTKDRKFKLVWGYLVKISAHELQLRYTTHIYCIRSDYNLLEMLNGEILDGFLVKSRFSRYYKLRPLPYKAEFFDSLSESEFPELSLDERKELIYEDPDIVAKTKRQELLAEELREKVRRNQENAYSQVLFAQTLPGQLVPPGNSIRNLTDQDCADGLWISKPKRKQKTLAYNNKPAPENSGISPKWAKKVQQLLNK